MSRICYVLFFFSIFLGQSCSTKSQKGIPVYEDVSVNIENSSVPSAPVQIRPGVSVAPAGPAVPEGMDVTTSVPSQRQPVVAIILGPGLNRSFFHIPFLRALAKSSVPVHIISGTDLSAVIGALYAAGNSSEKIEWLFYKWFKEARGLKPYSANWNEKVRNTLMLPLKNLQIENLKKFFILPLYDAEQAKILYWSRGPIFPSLLSNFVIYSGKENKLTSAFQWSPYDRSILEKAGADIVIGVNVLGEKIDFKKTDDFLVGVWGKVIGISLKQRSQMDLFFDLPIDMPLDGEENLPQISQRCYEYGELAASEIKKRIEDWKINLSDKKSAVIPHEE